MRHLRQSFRIWFPIAAAVTCLSLLIYATVQQSLRQSANDPQIQMAEDAARALETGTNPPLTLPDQQVEISTSLAPYIIVFDSKGNYLASSATLDGKPPTLPVGVFDYARAKGEHRVTWQPRADVRSAVVIVPFKSANQTGFVAAGRSLREVEKRTERISFITFLVWLVTLIVTLAVTLFVI